MNSLIRKRKLMDFLKRKEALSVLFISLFVFSALFIIFVGPKINQWGMHEGDISLNNVYAPYDFSYRWGIDEDKTQTLRNEKAGNVPYFLYKQKNTQIQVKDVLSSFFVLLEKLKSDESTSNIKADLLKDLSPGLSDRNIKILIDHDDPSFLSTVVLTTVDQIYNQGYVDESLYNFLEKGNSNYIVIFDPDTEIRSFRELGDLIQPLNLPEKIDILLSGSVEDRKIKAVLDSMIKGVIVPDMVLSEERTNRERDTVISSVPPVPKVLTVEKNEIIVEKGKKVTAKHIAQIAQLKSIFRPGTKPTFFFGIVLLFLLLGLAGSIYLSFTEHGNVLSQTKNIGMILLNMIGIIILSDFIVRSPLPSYFIPMASMGMILVLVVGFTSAFLSVLLLTFLISLLIGGGIELMLVLWIGSMVGIYAVKGARKRNRILFAGFFLGVAKFMAIVCIGLINSMELHFYLREALWGIASGIFSGFLVMGLLPIFEQIFKVTTNISLLELSDLNHPLLKELAMKAPGTYHHSIMVGNLAESACDAIGADSLLARVGSYYHDIGKIPKAEYFTENEMGSGSRHNNLTPSMSALIISKHVKEGIELSNKYNLNSSIVDFISQHHGDSLIAFFYQKAMEKSKNAGEVKESDFRYPGPKPQTKESAIIMLADSVEASSRALDEPTSSSIRNLVRKIVNNKFIDGQLDECSLTLRDMHEIADSFVRVLMGIFHTRPEYPDEKLKNINGKNEKNSDLLRKSKQKKKN